MRPSLTGLLPGRPNTGGGDLKAHLIPISTTVPAAPEKTKPNHRKEVDRMGDGPKASPKGLNLARGSPLRGSARSRRPCRPVAGESRLEWQ